MKQYICVITCENAKPSDGFVREARFCSSFDEAVTYGDQTCIDLKPVKAEFWIYEYAGFDSYDLKSARQSKRSRPDKAR